MAASSLSLSFSLSAAPSLPSAAAAAAAASSSRAGAPALLLRPAVAIAQARHATRLCSAPFAATCTSATSSVSASSSAAVAPPVMDNFSIVSSPSLEALKTENFTLVSSPSLELLRVQEELLQRHRNHQNGGNEMSTKASHDLASVSTSTSISTSTLTSASTSIIGDESVSASDSVRRGGLIPSVVMTRLLRARLSRVASGCSWILDGYPRTCDQVHSLLQDVTGTGTETNCHTTPVFIQMTACDDTVRGRIATRRATSAVVREDDASDTVIETRLATYRAQLPGILDALRQRGVVTVDVDATGGKSATLEQCLSALGKSVRRDSHPNVVLIGPPGVGKGTLAEQLADALHAEHVSTGELVRQAMAADNVNTTITTTATTTMKLDNGLFNVMPTLAAKSNSNDNSPTKPTTPAADALDADDEEDDDDDLYYPTQVVAGFA